MTALPLSAPLLSDPNESQRAASDPAASVWVNASAGSGKTSVLTKRVVRLLLSGVPPEKILCLTYTRAGAAEMANRVTGLLSQWAVCSETDLRSSLDKLQNASPTDRQINEARRLFARVLACAGGLRIRTIHSFCQEILSRFPLEAGLPPHFALIDDEELKTLTTEVLDALILEAGAAPDSALARALGVLIAAQSEGRFADTLKEMTAGRGRLEEAVEQAGGEKNLIHAIRTFLMLEPEDTPDSLRRAALRALPEEKLRPLARWLAEDSKSFAPRGEKLLKVLETPPHERAAFFDLYLSVFLTQKQEPYDKTASKKVLEAHPEIDEICQTEASRLLSVLERIDTAFLAQQTESVLSFGFAFSRCLAARKKARAALDYEDLILRTEKLLNRPGIAPWILYKLDNGIAHILVDEAQDTSRPQWNIVQALTAEFYAGETASRTRRTLFVVGDEKQSIFSFQNADPEAFLSRRAFFTDHFAQAEKPLRHIPLRYSFRSASAILKAVDHVFADAKARDGVSLDPVTHEAYKKDLAGRVEVWPLLKPTPEEEQPDGTWILPTTQEEEKDPQAELATLIAQKIKRWLKTSEILDGMDHPVRAGDIMILLRKRGRFADLMVRALKTNGVPVTGVDRMHLIRQLAVMDLLSMVQFVLLPEDDLTLASLLRSPLIGLSEEDLMTLAVGRSGSLWQSLTEKAGLFPAIYAYLSQKRAEADASTPFLFLSRLLNEPCPADSISGRRALWARLGEEALDPIEELLNAAQNFGARAAPSLQNFLHWLTKADAEIKREMDTGMGQVRIMTVHASKGLEAPIVFLPDTVSLPQMQRMPKLQWTEEGLPLFMAQNPRAGPAQSVWQKSWDRQMQEYRRLFYVALTRASQRLYIGGWLGRKGDEAQQGSWYGLAQALKPLHQEHIAPEEGDGLIPEIIFADPILRPAEKALEKQPEPLEIRLPDWAFQPVKTALVLDVRREDTVPTASPDAAFARGRLIHRLLQSLPDLRPEKRPHAVARFLAHPRHGLTADQQSEIACEVESLMQDERFTALFAANALAEAPITGSLNGVTVFRQVDRLCLCGDEVWIVDYKTNRPPPARAADIPAAYRTQMDEYRTLLTGIYPDKKIRTFLLWTYAPRLMEVH